MNLYEYILSTHIINTNYCMSIYFTFITSNGLIKIYLEECKYSEDIDIYKMISNKNTRFKNIKQYDNINDLIHCYQNTWITYIDINNIIKLYIIFIHKIRRIQRIYRRYINKKKFILLIAYLESKNFIYELMNFLIKV